jgi:maltose O-acetyltransferase
VAPLTDQVTKPSERIAAGDAADARPRGFAAHLVRARRRITARLRGEQDLPRLLKEGLCVGRDVYIARRFYFDPGFVWLISIGDESTLGPGVTILTHDAVPKLRTGYSVVAPVRIGARVFIGANATILPGVEIGDDAIVGAGSVVRRDVPPGAIVLGNPAREIGATTRNTERHRAQLEYRPRYRTAGPDGLRGISEADRRQILDELRDGPGYVD